MASAPRQVLVVDDDSGIRHVLVESLRDEGYAVKEADNGQSALAMLNGWRPDVIVLDLMMPVMDGWAFRTEQHRLGLAADVPVVVLSASRSLAVSAQEVGAAAVLVKPFDLAALLEAIDRVVVATA